MTENARNHLPIFKGNFSNAMQRTCNSSDIIVTNPLPIDGMFDSPKLSTCLTERPDAPPLGAVARLCLSAGRLLLESGANGRVVHEAIANIAAAVGCDSAEVMCQHAAVLVIIHRDAEACMQMCKVGEHGVNLRRSQAIRAIINQLEQGKLDCAGAEDAINATRTTTPTYPVWFVCLSTGVACGAFGRLLGGDWPSFLPITIGTAAGQWLRHMMLRNRLNIFVTAGLVSFVAASIAGAGASLAGSVHSYIATATVASVLLLVPGVAVLNAQIDALEAKPNLAAARALRILYLLLFMALGLALAQALVLPHQ